MTQGGPEAPPTCYRHPDRETWIRCQRCDRPICPDCMRSAAVGFQCPECVAEGARSTRQLLTPYGGKRVSDPRLTSLVLIGINVALWLVVLATGGRSSRIADELALLPSSAVARYPDGTEVLVRGVSDGAVWQLLTSAFLHVQPLHIAFNMLALYFLGPTLESVLGRTRYLALYLVSALSGSAVVMVFSQPNTPTLGASGAIFGLMGALAVVALKVRGEAQQVLLWIGINLVITFTLPNISWQGHLGGLVAGAAIGAAMVYAPKQRRSLVQWSAVAAVALLAVAAIGVRVAVLA